MSERRNGMSWTALVGVALAASMCLSGATGCKGGKKRRPEIAKEAPPGGRIFTPDWYDVTDRAEDGAIHETAQAVGGTVTMSENMATNQARQGLALAIEGRVDVLQRAFAEQVDTSSDPELLRRFQNVNTIVASQTLRGSRVVRKETYREEDQFRTFVLMALDPREIDAMYLETLKSIEALETRLRSTEAWGELEERARELREEKRRGGMQDPMTDREIRGGR